MTNVWCLKENQRSADVCSICYSAPPVHTSQAQTHVLSSHDATSTISLCIYLRFQTQNTTYRKRIQIILLVSLSQVMQIMAGGIYKVL